MLVKPNKQLDHLYYSREKFGGFQFSEKISDPKFFVGRIEPRSFKQI
jgi:hypothetical protein